VKLAVALLENIPANRRKASQTNRGLTPKIRRKKRKMMYRSICTFCFILITMAINAEISGDKNRYYPKDNWRTSPPEKQQLNPLYLDQMHARFDTNGLIVVIRNGYLIDTKKPADLSRIEHIHSCTKSVISLLYGMIFEEDTITKPVVDYFPEYARGDNRQVAIYHLLTMTSGMDWSDNPNIDSRQLPYEANWVKYILSKRIVEKPGSKWNYNSGGSQLLSVLMQQKLHYPLRTFANNRLFKPLNITDYAWWDSNDGYLTAGWGLHLSVFSITKLGYLVLNNGQWNGESIVSSRWIQESTTRKVTVNDDYSYGYQWWIYDCLPYDAYKAHGNFGDHSVMIILIPKIDLEVVLVGNFRNDIEILRDYIIPSAENNK
jgi:CubicO group peptidase (beta-lactamase class C family)